MQRLRRVTSKSGDDFFVNMNVGDKFSYSIFWGYVVDKALKGGAIIDKCGFEMGIVTEKHEVKSNDLTYIIDKVSVPEHLKKQKKKYLKHERPDIFKQLHPTKNKDMDIGNLSLGSIKRVWWLCENDHEWETTVSSRTQIGKGNCPDCWRSREISGNNFTKSHPILSKFWDRDNNGDYTPETSTTRDGIRINFTCDKGHKFSRMLFNKLPDRCPKCKLLANHPLRSLNIQEASLVKKLYKEGFKKIDISKKTGFNYKVVDNIISGRTYKDID
ncbi:zinc-ribbon domain-containing protein [Paenibacillus sp. CFBP 13594]|uniref:zinc-ribbon domain-containing protein n=1 Tax=Paenibacillus sp. CFBP 13594 TaxID=2774037 RepID=UPI0017808CC5|nr:zinc-ribbon domain-containing protein [Paenibacillus sp. CFBP 13594]MBD8839419.1 zinc-ribbon domain-containing protein [Paenibacillus sp. CFBP 13594]